ncbi:uncharacterized protein EI90DRAFT_3127335 [Cantharellus anzutake]|uniref:uncharacterized protein n=1 Tax=Cantharellus anzutake TaxID=1750568 RepID=UPI001904019A|nr:uncharacterized protein EI90DRAFT_3127335 [Cantharellus anzutake]KAF8327282.1 hypothetical protein EI90DRAFT_3127335 [Cantharellus anzutake]
MSSDTSPLGDRPMRRRSVTSPRTPFTPFSPALKFRSPVIPTIEDPLPIKHDEGSKIRRAPLIVLGQRIKYSRTAGKSPGFNLYGESAPNGLACPSCLWRRRSMFFKYTAISLFALCTITIWVVTWHVVRNSSVSPPGPIEHLDSPFQTTFPSNSPSALSNLDYLGAVPLRTQSLGELLAPATAPSPSTISIFALCPNDDFPARMSDLLLRINAGFTFSTLHSITFICLRSQAREAALFLDEHGSDDLPVFVVHNGTTEATLEMNLIHMAAQSLADWVLLIDEDGVADISLETWRLLHPLDQVVVPFGVRGVTLTPSNALCISPHPSSSGGPVSTAFLIPPFFIRTEVLRNSEHALFLDEAIGIWANLGRRISSLPGTNGVGGLVAGPGHGKSSDWCSRALQQVVPSTEVDFNSNIKTHRQGLDALRHAFHKATRENGDRAGTFVVALPSLSELRQFLPTLCRLGLYGNSLRIFLYSAQDGSRSAYYQSSDCHLHYDVIGDVSSAQAESDSVENWLSRNGLGVNVVITAAGNKCLDRALPYALDRYLDRLNQNQTRPTLIRIPRDHLKYLVWTSTLSVTQWQSTSFFVKHTLAEIRIDWHIPKLELVVITNNRPKSLRRLFESLQRAVFFGDRLHLYINVEQTADEETMAFVRSLEWDYGNLHIRHRVILGGLLPAVVESWYPSSNDSYGLILEDDVELSPAFYAWAKMNMLQYRYGAEVNRSPRLFGISLYQQKTIELRPEGRRPFNATHLFHSSGIRHASTPYLSQVPCSWGAIYFPEVWREFHEYLIDRLSERIFDIETLVVPDSRSNKWTKSWKKFFIELVFLRGYLMLYPNYPNFTSFSTNHLEAGTHVRRDAVMDSGFAAKKAAFELPLMPLTSMSILEPSLFGLPNGRVPRWEELPVVDLWGALQQERTLVAIGFARHTELVADKCAVSNESLEWDGPTGSASCTVRPT